ncbi:MAG: hypothetical protein ACD_30C00039G0007 [uncultured bacterium]|uniref:Uncharacterized protein n=4 Tax=Candidatus Daviesiibacteriota TaxID=1752718 RepID=A0A0G0H8X6_9BACT|nr:MAG: hypothetical protein ACD_30C00039G0007 [uncultured bacterium]KKQ08549.1 MAG: hypothetical protein US19_C0022G0010 [Candidatus Daviesbacteria bacterium GW2011_GWB1_36_5]KKQ13913.1 MAG: hypothetical protein US28_C0042G0012 [Candidatus Daviesbacteria bacterium GW2011_GWA1_36_8]OGE17105.1 MAG: hypothetical protein A2858_00165 [Candidatus Daviesbacteria bacterium RIFCSPHIGHO2_01_FULL_36_37]OGE31255.1 MAG: hypothetical protein A3C99_01250 [Candidatus Daviesbacteria bacterium RIFCSPHIGHO2_02_F
MTKQIQTSKNLKLSAEVAEYITKNPELVEDFGKDLSFVVFPSDDKQLQKANVKLANELKKEGKNVVKVHQTKDKKTPWKFSYL